MTRAVSPGVRSAKPTTTDLSESESPSLKLGYFQASEQPLASLFFVLPMIIVYEIGTRWYATDPVHGTEERIIAFNLMRQFFNVLGAHGRYLPCFAVIAILFTIHLFRKDSWVVQPTTLLGMGFESILLVIPLLLAGQMVIHYLQHLTLVALDTQDREMIVTFFGAGIYEEMVFRLAGFAILSLFFRDVLKLNKQLSMLLIVVCSGILFSLYHYLGNEQFQWPSFVFRTFAGIYFGVIMMARGFGVTAGTHTAYDILVWCMR